MSVTNASFDPPFSCGPSPHADTDVRVAQLIGLEGVIPCTLVCQAWHNTIQDPSIWFTLFDTESIPRIAEHDVATAKEDFQFMYPRTHGVKQMAPLGRFVGILPQVDPVVFEIFRATMDLYDPTKKMSETWVFVIEPEGIYRNDVDDKLIEALKTHGDFDADATDEDLKKQGILLPYSLKNLKVCAEHPIPNKDIKVFNYFQPEVLNQFSTISKAVRVTLMRKEVPESTRNKTWPQQKDELAKNEHVPVKLCTRVFYNATNILNKGTCPDKKEKNRWTFSRTADEIKRSDDSYPPAIGSFYPDGGFRVSIEVDSPSPYAGAAAVLAEVRPSLLGLLAPENSSL